MKAVTLIAILNIVLDNLTKAGALATTTFQVLGNLRYLRLILSKLGQDFAMLLVNWPVLLLTSRRAVTYSFAPRTKLIKSLFRGGKASAMGSSRSKLAGVLAFSKSS
jgi:hypothetical protein